MITSGNQNQFPFLFAPLEDLLKALMFLSKLNSFNSSPSSPDQGFAKRKGSSKVWKEKSSKWFSHFSLSPSNFGLALLVCFAFLFWVNLVFMLCFFNMFLFVCLQFYYFFFCLKKKFEKSEKYQNSVCFVYIGTCVPWMAIETKFSKLCIFCNLDEYLYAQLSKWALWLVFVMSKIK